MEPDFIYTVEQFNETNERVQKLVMNPIQKYLAGQEINSKEKADLEKALPLIDQMIQFDPITINSYSLKGKVLRALDRDGEAKIAFLDGLTTAPPKQEVQDELVRADLLLELAQLHFASGEMNEAIAASEKSIKLNDNSAIAHTIIAKVAYQRNDIQRAKNECLKALLADANYEPARTLFRTINAK
ncbi:MAG: hypothetical protein KF824_03370 [Fimbriimonadaceae bacterium]|nr:MAG: hypothetical protein KF824_03370 [Fimbriimonadaceae bacterium]